MSACVVVVEDEADVRSLLRDLLESDGFDVLAYGHPKPVQAMPENLHPDVFLVDLMLPGMTGIELVERLRDQNFSGTPMLAMSASDYMLRRARASGLFAETVSKPFDVGDLLDTVERYAA